MSLWAKSDSSNAAPIFPGVSTGIAASANGATLYGNTRIGAFQAGYKGTVGIFGVDTTEQGVAQTSNTKPQHAGWVLVTKGTGPIASLTANANSYSPDSVSPNGNVYLTFSGGGTGTTAANAQIIANATTGLITSIRINTGGNYERAPVVGAVANSNVSITIVMGGRAGRTQTETLVAMGTIGTQGVVDGSDDAIFPDA
jgi:hypothetical protein